ITSAVHSPKETIVTPLWIVIFYGAFIAYSVSYAVNSNKVEQEGQEKTNYSNK
ncbi:YqhR family membrane protein, partial [Bacillus cereus]|uniref:YqhR family membrane protein n=1 Tax=Bacillus cereus TaxID=1396 RepID=UPI002404B2DE